jgi:glycosyltransferase involved in cell wall biosynthesis
MTKPFLSIVTISFNQAQFLRQCIDSVVSQKGNDVEYIVVDPGSTDGSREILQSYGSAIDHLVLEPDKGPADGLNKGFARATGEIGYFINSDDFLLPSAIGRMRRLWQQNTQADLLLGGAWMLDGAGKPIRELKSTRVSLEGLLASRSLLVQQGMSFRMAAFERAGGFNAANRTCWDLELLCAILRLGARATVTSERFGAFRLYDASLSGGVNGARHTQRFKADIDRISQDMTGKPLPDLDLYPSMPARISRGVHRPAVSLSQLRDRIFPAAMHRRWKRDLRAPEGTGL